MKADESVLIVPRSFLRNATVVIASTWLVTLYIALDYGMELGRDEPKVCAQVPGHEVVSTTAETCTYARAYGRARYQRRAM